MKLFFIAFLVLLSLSTKALVRIEPPNPVEGQAVQLFYSDCEPPFPHVDSGEFFNVNTNGNQVQFVGFYTFSLPTCPIIYERTYDLGSFSEGEYEVEVYLFPADFPLPIDLSTFPPNELLSFGISNPVSVPILSWFGLFILTFLVVFITFKQRMVDI